MADALNDEFYFSDTTNLSTIPLDILQGEALDSDIESIEGSSSITSTNKLLEPTHDAIEAFIGHSIHPDRMIIPSLKRHANEELQKQETLFQKDKVVPRLKKKRLEDIIPDTMEAQLAHLLRAYAKYKKPTSFEIDNITRLTENNLIDSIQQTGSLQSLIQACNNNDDIFIISI